MSIEVRVPEEITDYKAKILFGLTGRQILGACIGSLIGFGSYYFIKPFIGEDTAIFVTMALSSPVFAWGFISPEGYAFEKYLKIICMHRLESCKCHYQIGEDKSYAKPRFEFREKETNVSFFSKKSSNKRKREIKRQLRHKELAKEKDAKDCPARPEI